MKWSYQPRTQEGVHKCLTNGLQLFLPLRTELRGAVLAVVWQGGVAGVGKNKFL